jgi:hypothetical protein
MSTELDRNREGHVPAKLIAAMERAAHAGWPETARLACLFLAASSAVTLILLTWQLGATRIA